MLTELPSPSELKGAVAGTMLCLSLYVGFQSFQSFTSMLLMARKKKEWQQKQDKDGGGGGGSGDRFSYRSIKYYNNRDFLALWGDRTAGNFREWLLVFLPLLWMHALFVNPQQSFTISLYYTLARLLYPFFYRRGGMVLLSTVPSYVVMIFMFQQLAVHVLLV